MTDTNPTSPVIIVNINGLKTPNRRQRVAE